MKVGPHPKIYNVGTSTKSDIKAQKDKLKKYAKKLDSEERSQTQKHCGWPITQLWKMQFS